MTSRRLFLQIGVTATALPVATGAASAAARISSPTLPIHAAVVDSRFAASEDFAARCRTLGLATLAFDGDMTSVWYRDVYPRWRQSPVAIAGMTGQGALFCFEQLARDERMKVFFLAEHRLSDTHRVEHRLTGPITMLADALRLESGSGSFGRCMAEVIAACPIGPSDIAEAVVLSPVSRPMAAPESALFSWVIAPASAFDP